MSKVPIISGYADKLYHVSVKVWNWSPTLFLCCFPLFFLPTFELSNVSKSLLNFKNVPNDAFARRDTCML